MTKIIIAQRITSVMNTDQIVILEDGKVHCTGTHKELLAHDAIYQEIYKSQMSGAQENEMEHSAAKKADQQENKIEQSAAKAERGGVQVKGGTTDGSENLQR